MICSYIFCVSTFFPRVPTCISLIGKDAVVWVREETVSLSERPPVTIWMSVTALCLTGLLPTSTTIPFQSSLFRRPAAAISGSERGNPAPANSDRGSLLLHLSIPDQKIENFIARLPQEELFGIYTHWLLKCVLTIVLRDNPELDSMSHSFHQPVDFMERPLTGHWLETQSLSNRTPHTCTPGSTN